MGILTDKTCQWFWDELNCRVSRTGAIPTTLNQLRAKIVYEWNNLPQNYVQRNVMLMRRRCLADQVWSLLKYWKNVNFDFSINSNFAFAFFTFLFYSK